MEYLEYGIWNIYTYCRLALLDAYYNLKYGEHLALMGAINAQYILPVVVYFSKMRAEIYMILKVGACAHSIQYSYQSVNSCLLKNFFFLLNVRCTLG